MLRVCLIGLGKMGSNHARVLYELQDEGKIKVIGVADINEEVARRIGEEYGFYYVTDYKILLKRKPDIAIIVVPTKLHHKVAIDAIEEGCNVFVEKPIAYTIAEAKEIVKAARKKKIKIMVGHIERFNPIIHHIKEKINGKQINLIGIVRVGPTSQTNESVILDLGVHDIDIIRYLTGSEFKNIKILANNRHIVSGAEKSSIILFEMKNGALVYLVTNTITPIKVRRIEVTTNDEFIFGDFISQKVTEYSQGEIVSQSRRSMFVTEVDMPYVEPLKAELKAFIKSVKSREPSPVTGEDGLKALEIATKCIKQLNSKR